MADVWSVDASPLIVLAKIGRLDLFTQLGATALLPAAVVQEVLAGPVTDPARVAIESGWGQRAGATPVPERITQWSLGPGESAALALASQRLGAVAVLDDAEARACARVLGVPVLGTLAIVLLAKRRAAIPSIVAILDDLRDAGFFVSDALAAQVAAAAGEE